MVNGAAEVLGRVASAESYRRAVGVHLQRHAVTLEGAFSGSAGIVVDAVCHGTRIGHWIGMHSLRHASAQFPGQKPEIPRSFLGKYHPDALVIP